MAMKKLAIDGGAPAFRGEIPGWPTWGEPERKNLAAALSEAVWGTLGPRALAFAKRYAEYVGARHAIAVNTGTQALELLLRGAGIGRGDEVIVPPYTFVATVAAVANVGATPVFADVDLDTGCIDAASVDRAVTPATRAVIAVHIAGRPCDIDALLAVARRRSIALFEDAAHAHGSEWRGRRAGSLGDAAAFSFQSSKTLTGGEGGLIATDDEGLFAGCWQWHHSGRPLQGAQLIGGDVGLGTNGRMAEWQAAILDAQLDRLDAQNEARERGAALLDKALPGLRCIRRPAPDPRVTKNGHFLYQFRLETGALRVGRAQFLQALNAEGVPATAGYAPLHRMGMLQCDDFRRLTGAPFEQRQALPAAEALCESAVWLPGRALLMDAGALSDLAAAVQKVALAYQA
ncbi:MAG: DegT/DnrJ/EryC1/StrS family aminotransferase [Clostridiales bacterium]|nr:DegT/DnrJ/EryC1/StrS family aminotransferase [Clostridiales bacterium]